MAERIIGKRAIGTRIDRSFRTNYHEDFPRGWKTIGTVAKYDPKMRKYLIEGQNYIFNETGEFPVNGSGDWFSRSQIEILKE